jgi:hypothetical protein
MHTAVAARFGFVNVWIMANQRMLLAALLKVKAHQIVNGIYTTNYCAASSEILHLGDVEAREALKFVSD